ncbi:MAG: TIGR02147 family protein [Chitinivibrionales bacterium]|nr:TIGR02147 family protein [Chitinivibrionales bacterium]
MMVDVFTYTDFRAYLHDFYEDAKRENPHFSYRYIGRRVGFRSPGYFTQLLQGKVNLTQTMLHRFVPLLKLKRREAEYFELMVHFCQAKTQEERQRLFERMGSFKELAAHIISPDQYELYDKWYYAAIRDILCFYPFRGDYRELAQLVEPAISAREARNAVALLLRLGLIERTIDGRYVQTDAVVRARAQGYDVALARFAMLMMDQARDAIDRLPRHERSISWVGFAVSPQTYERMREEIIAFRSRMLKMAEQDPDPQRAYHLNLQLFPVSKPFPREAKR